MQNELIKVDRKKGKRLGRGYGSGKGGHTVGRGQKGQKARGSVGILFEGYKVRKSLIKRLPLRRGKGKFNAKRGPVVIDLELLNVFTSGSHIDINSLTDKNLVNKDDARKFGVKILGNGKLEKKLVVNVPASKKVRKQIEKMGGKVVEDTQDSKLKTQEHKVNEKDKA